MGEACATKGVGTQRGVHLKCRMCVYVCAFATVSECATKGVGTQRGVHLKWKTFVCVCVAVCVVVAREAPPRAWVDMQRGVHLKCGMCVCVVYVHAFATVFGCLCTWMLVCICLRVCALPQRFGAFA
jgi:hypothetical protein